MEVGDIVEFCAIPERSYTKKYYGWDMLMSEEVLLPMRIKSIKGDNIRFCDSAHSWHVDDFKLVWREK